MPKYLNERNRSFVSPKVKREGHFNLSVQPIVIGRSVTFLERGLYAQTDVISFCAQCTSADAYCTAARLGVKSVHVCFHVFVHLCPSAGLVYVCLFLSVYPV